MASKIKHWYHFSDEFIDFINELVTETFGTKSELASCMKKCLDIANVKASLAVCMYDISYMGCSGDRLSVYIIAFKSMGYNGRLIR